MLLKSIQHFQKRLKQISVPSASRLSFELGDVCSPSSFVSTLELSSDYCHITNSTPKISVSLMISHFRINNWKACCENNLGKSFSFFFPDGTSWCERKIRCWPLSQKTGKIKISFININFASIIIYHFVSPMSCSLCQSRGRRNAWCKINISCIASASSALSVFSVGMKGWRKALNSFQQDVGHELKFQMLSGSQVTVVEFIKSTLWY